jgi:AraC-like DNA-binding protein
MSEVQLSILCEKMSKMMMQGSITSPFRVRYYQVNRNLKNDTGMHSHPFWQTELIIKGRVRLETEGKKRLEAGEREIVIIPPDCNHRFRYLPQGCSVISIKYSCESCGCGELKVLERSPFTSPIIWSFESFLPKYRFLTQPEKEYLGHLLSPLMYTYMNYEEIQKLHLNQTLSERVMRFVRAHIRKPLTLETIAVNFNYSRSHLSAQFRLERGESIMQYVRRTKIDVTKEHVAYSEYSLKEISERYGFVDAYTFSKFFKRYVGVSPREFRSRFK